MTKIASYSVVHYGASYLPYALHSIASVVDVSYVFYTRFPSHDHSSNKKCPETIDDILGSISQLRPPYYNIKFMEQSSFKHEGKQRDWCKQYVIDNEQPDYLVVLDYDEIWPDGSLARAINEVSSSMEKKHAWRTNMLHFWRSFQFVCKDPGWPDRIFDVKVAPGEYGYINQENGPLHFGYAVTDEICKYKWDIHGHLNDLRSNWFEEKWDNWQPGVGDVHPTNDQDFWTPEPFNKEDLPIYMRSHPFYDLEIIQ